jgi:nucleoside-diphosphate-sugar epimerase
LYVTDAIDAVERALARPDAIGRTMNISTGRGTSINDLLATLSLLTGYMGTARHGALRRGDIRESSLDPHLAGRLLDWAPSTDLEAGLRLTLQSDGPDARR